MVFLIGGASHTGKTLLAQRLLDKYRYPYLSMDHLKMGLIRSGHTDLTPMDDDKMPELLWPIVKEMVKTVIENEQDLMVEGCYIPHNWAADFDEDYLEDIRYCCLVMTDHYIEKHFDDILAHGSDIEQRLDDSNCNMESLMADNRWNLEQCRKHGCSYILIDEEYRVGDPFAEESER